MNQIIIVSRLTFLFCTLTFSSVVKSEPNIDRETIEEFAQLCVEKRSITMCSGAGIALTEIDPVRSKVYLTIACEEGMSRACQIILDRDPNSHRRKVHTYLNDASLCNAGNGAACNQAGISTMNGIGTKKNLKESRVWFTMGCELENANSCHSLAIMQASGQGGVKDLSKSFKNSLSGCEFGHPTTCMFAGIHYLYGSETKINYSTALEYFIRGCDLAEAESCVYVGKMYATGEGVETNIPKGFKYIKQACLYGHLESCKMTASYNSLTKEH